MLVFYVLSFMMRMLFLFIIEAIGWDLPLEFMIGFLKMLVKAAYEHICIYTFIIGRDRKAGFSLDFSGCLQSSVLWLMA